MKALGLGTIQNFMTVSESMSIDKHYKLDPSIPTHALDDHLLDILLAEMRHGDRVFIYANKTGAHFPYQKNYPPDFNPSPQIDEPDSNRNAYALAIRWSVDRVIARFTRDADMREAAAIYTSDHGQRFESRRLTHCSNRDMVSPEEAMVPLMVMAGDDNLKAKFSRAAQISAGFGTHFAIAPTLLELMGFDALSVQQRYEESFFAV